MMKPPREWTLLGRPLGEWLLLLLLATQCVGTLRDLASELARQSPHGTVQWTMVLLRSTSGLSALGVIVAIGGGFAVGVRLLWLFALATTIIAPLATAVYSRAPTSDVLASLMGVAAACGLIVWYGRRRLHAAITRRQWPALIADHADAADEFVAAISGMTDSEWTTRPAPEAWSPAEITEHLARTYSQYAGEARGKNSLRIRLWLLPRLFARFFVKPRLLAGGAFPKATAPRSLRPSGGPPTPTDGVALFRATGEACLRDFGILAELRPYRRLVHPYFGGLPLYEMMRFAIHHIRHHRRQLGPPAHNGGAAPERR